jgi:DNA-binding MarR family transcriptional regulator
MPDKRSQTDGRVLACIDGGLTTVADIREQTKMANSTLYKVLGRLHDAGLITDYRDGPIERLLDREEEMA